VKKVFDTRRSAHLKASTWLGAMPQRRDQLRHVPEQVSM
jgi:hypothetical protein